MRAPKSGQNVVDVEPLFVSNAMKRLLSQVDRVANKDVTVMFLGETGTGKEVLARHCHANSRRRAGPFVPVNCAAIPEALFESELFGRERGAFTGAHARAEGKVESASGGTLFLDELAELPLALQPKLLRFLETRRFSRVGGTVKLSADVRLICASGKSLEAEVKAGRFRPDLYYRVQVISLTVPPLRERTADIEPLIDAFLAHFSRVHGVVAPRLSRSLRAALIRAQWPGNVRELRNRLEYLTLMYEGERLSRDALPPLAAAAVEVLTLPLDLTLAEMQDRIIDAVLASESGNRTRASKRLGVSARTLARRGR
ncbi:MAG: hypothetical protein DI536_29370 [Archangium gephyra]|uniref:Sigma-54 factor interaction domain-containing protein n=1 Tax=Archangium gephyra TaxID=48 RepID=A0A2W5SVM8_9BACT|nr:MAG: hypothetical protein DI536_29370 [Archangium gephyra]